MRNKLCGIYGLFDKRDNSCLYIGQSVDIVTRTNNHLRKIAKKNHNNYKIREWSENNSVNNINVRILVICSKRQLNDYESKIYNTYQPILNLEKPKFTYDYIGSIKKDRSKINYEYLYNLYIIENKTTSEIADLTNYSQRHICNLLKEYNIIKDEETVRKTYRKISIVDDKDFDRFNFDNNKIIEMYNNGDTISMMAKFYKCRPELIKQYIIRNNVLPMLNLKRKEYLCANCGVNHGKNGRKYCDNCAKQQKTNNRGNYPPPEEVYQLAKHIPYTHLAQQYGVSDNAIRKYLKANGYEPPRRKKA